MMNGPNRFSRVLVTRLDSLGDVLLAGPAVRAVAAGAKVTQIYVNGTDDSAVTTTIGNRRSATRCRP